MRADALIFAAPLLVLSLSGGGPVPVPAAAPAPVEVTAPDSALVERLMAAALAALVPAETLQAEMVPAALVGVDVVEAEVDVAPSEPAPAAAEAADHHEDGEADGDADGDDAAEAGSAFTGGVRGAFSPRARDLLEEMEASLQPIESLSIWGGSSGSGSGGTSQAEDLQRERLRDAAAAAAHVDEYHRPNSVRVRAVYSPAARAALARMERSLVQVRPVSTVVARKGDGGQ